MKHTFKYEAEGKEINYVTEDITATDLVQSFHDYMLAVGYYPSSVIGAMESLVAEHMEAQSDDSEE